MLNINFQLACLSNKYFMNKERKSKKKMWGLSAANVGVIKAKRCREPYQIINLYIYIYIYILLHTILEIL